MIDIKKIKDSFNKEYDLIIFLVADYDEKHYLIGAIDDVKNIDRSLNAFYLLSKGDASSRAYSPNEDFDKFFDAYDNKVLFYDRNGYKS